MYKEKVDRKVLAYQEAIDRIDAGDIEGAKKIVRSEIERNKTLFNEVGG